MTDLEIYNLVITSHHMCNSLKHQKMNPSTSLCKWLKLEIICKDTRDFLNTFNDPLKSERDNETIRAIKHLKSEERMKEVELEFLKRYSKRCILNRKIFEEDINFLKIAGIYDQVVEIVN